ncbi:MAG: hypothetical protein ABI611_16605 [Solirubrobacteraceae bacterium]
MSPFCVGEFEARVAEQLDDAIGGLVREVGCPEDQQVVVADVPLDGVERLEDPEPEAACGLGEAEARPPGDVLMPRLDGRFEQGHAASVGSTYAATATPSALSAEKVRSASATSCVVPSRITRAANPVRASGPQSTFITATVTPAIVACSQRTSASSAPTRKPDNCSSSLYASTVNSSISASSSAAVVMRRAPACLHEPRLRDRLTLGNGRRWQPLAQIQ